MVHLVVRQASGTLLALKTIAPAVLGTAEQVERFLREANILRQLDHPNIVRFQEMGTAAGQFYFAMEFVRGSDARQLLRRHSPLPVGRAVRLVCQMLEALAYAHAKGFVHRDVKPSNVLVTSGSSGELARLVDFGLARVYQASALSGLTLEGAVGGTMGFMPPEQILSFRDARPAADQYAAAATLYNLLTGRHVHDLPAAFDQQVQMILHDEPVPLLSRRPDLLRELAAVIHRALAQEPEKRFVDVTALRQALLPFSD
jgi:serine/threonine-protein kinase